MIADVARKLVGPEPGVPRARYQGASLALGRIAIEEHREIPVACGMLVASGARAEQHDPLDIIAERCQHPLAKTGDHRILRTAAAASDVQGRSDGHRG
jgi:hypothetical protein